MESAKKISGTRARRTRLFAGVVLAFSVMALGSGCALVNKATEDVKHQSEEFSGIKEVELNNAAGAITITGTNSDKLVAKRELTQQAAREARTKAEKTGDKLKLVGECSGVGAKCEIKWDIQLPKTVTITIVNKLGEIELSGIETESLNVDNKQGKITVGMNGSFKNLTLKGEGGDITVTVPGGRPYDVTVKGNSRVDKNIEVQQGSSGDKIFVETERGDVTVKNG